jgi:hypothetical protein
MLSNKQFNKEFRIMFKLVKEDDLKSSNSVNKGRTTASTVNK